MDASLPVLLCLGFCVVQALEEFYDLPAPRFEMEPIYPVPLGTTLILRCVGTYDSFNYRIHKEAYQGPLTLNNSCQESMSSVFHYPNVSLEQAGRFRCIYLFHSFWSKLSEPLDVRVAEVYEKPYLWAYNLSVPQGEDVTFHCNSSAGLDQFVLLHGDLKDGFKIIKFPSDKRNEAVIVLRNKTLEMNGDYRCYGYMIGEPYYWSAPSDVVVLSGVDLPPGCCTTVHLIRAVLALASLGILLS